MEEAHLKYLEAAQVNIEDNQEEADYLIQPNQEWEDAHKMYGDFMKDRKQLELDMERVTKFKNKLPSRTLDVPWKTSQILSRKEPHLPR